MAKKKDEKDVLVVRDEKTGEISVVAGLNADGTPKRTPAKAENAQSFLQFDRHGDVLDNFFKNFFRQCKEPSRFGFYRIAADQAENLLEVMKQLLKDPEANKELLAPHKVDTSDYEKKVQEEMAAQQTEKQEPQKQENMEQRKEQQQDKSEQMQGKRGYQPIDESKINWQELEDRWGVKRDNLEKSGDLTKMLNYGKSDLVKVKPTFGGESFELDARLSFKKDGEGNISLVPHFIRKEQKLDEYKEHKFSDNDRKNLRETGNLGRVVDIVDRETGEIIPSYISIDRKTNEITDIPASRVRIPERIGKTEITTQERDMLRAGLPVRDKLIERNDGRKFVTTLQVNVEQRGVEFVPGTGKSPRTAQTQETKGDTSKSQAQGGENAAQTKKEQRRNTWTNEDVLQKFDDYYHGYESADGKPMPGYVDMIEELQGKFPLTEPQVVGEQNQKDFITLFGAILRMRNLLVSFDEFKDKELLSERDLQDYLGRYQDLRDEWKRKRQEGTDITDDVVFEIELIRQIEINIDYILMLVKKYHDTNCEDKEVLVTIHKAIDASPELRSKKELIENFIAGVNDVDDVMDGWQSYVVEQRKNDLNEIITTEKLKPEDTRKFMENAFRDGEIKTAGTDIDKIMPPISRFGGGGRAKKKLGVIEKLRAFFEKYFGIGGSSSFTE